MPSHARRTTKARGLTRAEKERVLSCIGLAKRTALRVQFRLWQPEDLDDLIQDAYLGLCKAAQQYNPAIATRPFQVYAVYRMKSYIYEGLRIRRAKGSRYIWHDAESLDAQIVPWEEKQPDEIDLDQIIVGRDQLHLIADWLKIDRHADDVDRRLIFGLIEGLNGSELVIFSGVSKSVAYRRITSLRERLGLVITGNNS